MILVSGKFMSNQKDIKFNEIEKKYKDNQFAINFLKATWIFSRGSHYAKQGQTIKAIKDFEEAIRIKDDYLPAYYSLCLAFVETGEDKKAVKIFNKCPDVMKSGSGKIMAKKEDFWNKYKTEFPPARE